MVKRNSVIFTCMESRAMHLEVAYSLDTDACINVVQRLMCRRGQVSQIRSDNGTNFIGAERELREVLDTLDHSMIQRASHLLLVRIMVWEHPICLVRKVL